MNREKFKKQVEQIVIEDERYSQEAYEFISEAVSFTSKKFIKAGNKRHITGQELLEGISEFAKHQFGPMAGEVLEHWGIKDSLSIGHIVFNMAKHDLLATSDSDSIEDFREGLNFEEALKAPFKPSDSETHPPPIIA